MYKRIQEFIEYLIDIETASEIPFSQYVQEHHELFGADNRDNFERNINSILQKWNIINRTEQNKCISKVTNTVDSSNEKLQRKYSSSPPLSEEEEEAEEEERKLHKKHKYHLIEKLDSQVDIVHQCERLLQFLHYCQQHCDHLVDLYFNTLEQFIKNENDQIVTVTLKQIASHLSGNSNRNNERKRLIQFLPPDMSAATIPPLYRPFFDIIQSLLSTNNTEKTLISLTSLDDIEVLYPYTARFLDVRREFRDSTQYFIDGDSLLLSIANHINVDLISYYGNTLHVIYIIERILLVLFNQSHQCNYTIVFFDCHSRLYQQENSILALLRSCLIAHLSKNADKCGTTKIQQFSSWLDENYLKFAHEERPMFLFYHDMINLDKKNNNLLSANILQRLRIIYHLFGNYHQYVIQCQLYLMNKLILTDDTVKCFQIRFKRQFPTDLLQKINELMSNLLTSDEEKLNDQNKYEKLCQETSDSDARLFLYLKTLVNFMEENKEQHLVQLLSQLLVLHVALLVRLSLIDRHLLSSFPSVTFSPAFTQLIVQFQQRLSANLTSSSSTLSWSKVADLFDGRLFAFTLYQSSTSNIRLDSKTLEMINQSLSILNIPSSDNLFQDVVKQMIELNDINFSLILSQQLPETNNQTQRHRKIAKISNTFIDTYLKPIYSSSSESKFELIPPNDMQIPQYEGKHHWHVYKEVGDELSRIRDNKDQSQKSKYNHKYRTRNDQLYYTYLTIYGQSLNSPNIQNNQLKIFLPPTASSPTQKNSDGQSKKTDLTKGEIIIEENKQRIIDKQIANDKVKLANIKTRLEKIPADNYADAIQLIDGSLMDFEKSPILPELLKQKFDLQRNYLKSLKKKSSLTTDETSKFELLQIGFFATMTEMAYLENMMDVPKKLSRKKKKFMKELIDDPSLDAEKWYRFQLEKINSRLPRYEQSDKDDRVPDFIPDKWQVKFLDAVDNGQSIIIVARTASGKTYASYYAMNKVLKDKDNPNGICVYVAPTKALVNQVAATVYSKFAEYAKFGPVFGIFTRDYRANVHECRILVTVPHCLQILLLSPKTQRWCQRIQYCIFDEIHCMSGEIGSDVWERTMLLINCPMIRLSATVNNGENLCQWIQKVEDRRSALFKSSKSRQVRYIVHHERLADLNKFLYSEGQLHPLRPVSLMNAKQVTARGVPKDFSLSPCETLQLKDSMQAILDKDTTLKQVPTLSEYFSPDWIIERRKCDTYSRCVCDQFNNLITDRQNSAIDSIAESLDTFNSNNISYPEPKPMSSLIVDFLLTLKEKNLLPCMVFSDSRWLCEQMAASVADYFIDLEHKLRETKYKKQIEAIEKRLLLIEKSQSTACPSRRNNDSNDNAMAELRQMDEEDQSQVRLSDYEQYLLNGILNEGTLANRRDCNQKIVDTLLEEASRNNSRLVDYIKRGVAYHHAGINNKRRVAVEALFRTRYVQLVFSTSTLAQGIHMPTKTVAFLRDSIYLDALQYRQSSGRAGRRGFDVQGYIVFLDIPISKIRHLTISAIPDIKAHFPTSVTFLMRLLHLCSNAEDKKDAINRSLVALECPFISLSPIKCRLIDIQTRFHCLHSLDFLHKLNLINGKGDLVGLAGLLTHLHYMEPANLLLVYLIDTQLFHGLDTNIEIINVLARLFTNMPWLITRKQVEILSLTRRRQTFNSKLFLPPISNDFSERVESYNSIVKGVYGFYIENVIRYMRSSNDNQEQILPFSNVSFIQPSDYDDGTFEYNLHHHHSQQSLNPSISPFSAPSGLSHDTFMTNYNPTTGSWDLAYDLDLSSRIVPFVDIDARDHTNSSYYLNSYAVDFFRHGSEASLMSENQLGSGDTNSLLLDFLLMLSSIETSLQTILRNENKQTTNNDVEFFQPLFEKLSCVKKHF